MTQTRAESGLTDVTSGEAEGRGQDGRWASGVLSDAFNLLAEHGEDLRKQNVYKKLARLVEKPMHRSQLTGGRRPQNPSAGSTQELHSAKGSGHSRQVTCWL